MLGSVTTVTNEIYQLIIVGVGLALVSIVFQIANAGAYFAFAGTLNVDGVWQLWARYSIEYVN